MKNFAQELEAAARKLAKAVEHDMNGTMGKGGNGGLLSDTTLRAAHEVQAILSRPNPRNNGTPLTYPDELTGDLKTVLSKMLWETGQIAELLRAGGEAIPHRAEDEQAHVLHWLIKLLLKHGDDYRTAAVEHLRKCDVARNKEASQ